MLKIESIREETNEKLIQIAVKKQRDLKEKEKRKK